MTVFSSLLKAVAPNTDDKRQALAAAFREVRALTAALSAPLEAEDQQVQSCPEVSPTKWHLAHSTWFFETFVLARADSAYAPFHPRYDFLFNSYYHSVGPMHARPNRGLLTRPTLAEVRRYRAAVEEAVLKAIAGAGGDLFAELVPIIELGLHHEQQHQELLLTDIKHVLSCNPLLPAAYSPAEAAAAGGTVPCLRFVAGPEGPVEIGGETGGAEGFRFDHEGPRHLVYLTPHELGDRLITNGEFLSFIDAGGYEDHRLWLSDGWDEIRAERRQHPLYWRQIDGAWFEFTHYGLEPLVADRPVVNISYYEAQAFAYWTGARLPREAELEVAARQTVRAGRLLALSGAQPTSYLRPNPAGAEEGLKQIVGDAWEWTESAFLPYPGYRAPPTALGEYNGKFMSGQVVLRGGSFATPIGHMRPTYRNFFQPGSRWQITGLRLARDLV